MRSLVLDVPAGMEIEINGHIFEVLQSDIDILTKSAEFSAKYAELKKGDTSSILEAVRSIAAYIDEILGEGAVYKISGGKPVGIACAAQWLTAICREIAQEYGEAYEKYEKMMEEYISGKYEK